MGATHEFRIDEGQRQMTLLALAVLGLERPGWVFALGELADAFEGRDLYEEFMRLNADLHPPRSA